MKEIFEDIERRNAQLAGVIVQDEDGQFQFIAYDEDAVITFVSDKADTMIINERLEGRMIRPLALINSK